ACVAVAFVAAATGHGEDTVGKPELIHLDRWFKCWSANFFASKAILRGKQVLGNEELEFVICDFDAKETKRVAIAFDPPELVGIGSCTPNGDYVLGLETGEIWRSFDRRRVKLSDKPLIPFIRGRTVFAVRGPNLLRLKEGQDNPDELKLAAGDHLAT